jgi:hypothetical protein
LRRRGNSFDDRIGSRRRDPTLKAKTGSLRKLSPTLGAVHSGSLAANKLINPFGNAAVIIKSNAELV